MNELLSTVHIDELFPLVIMDELPSVTYIDELFPSNNMDELLSTIHFDEFFPKISLPLSYKSLAEFVALEPVGIYWT